MLKREAQRATTATSSTCSATRSERRSARAKPSSRVAASGAHAGAAGGRSRGLPPAPAVYGTPGGAGARRLAEPTTIARLRRVRAGSQSSWDRRPRPSTRPTSSRSCGRTSSCSETRRTAPTRRASSGRTRCSPFRPGGLRAFFGSSEACRRGSRSTGSCRSRPRPPCQRRPSCAGVRRGPAP